MEKVEGKEHARHPISRSSAMGSLPCTMMRRDLCNTPPCTLISHTRRNSHTDSEGGIAEPSNKSETEIKGTDHLPQKGHTKSYKMLRRRSPSLLRSQQKTDVTFALINTKSSVVFNSVSQVFCLMSGASSGIIFKLP